MAPRSVVSVSVRFAEGRLASVTGFMKLPFVEFPVRRDLVVGMKLRCPSRVRHARPVILVEALCVLEFSLNYVEYKAFFARVEGERSPWNRKKLCAHTQEATERQHCVR